MTADAPPDPAPPRTFARIQALAALMREHRFGPEGGLSVATARAAGFTLAEIDAYRDRALDLLDASRPVVVSPTDERVPGADLVRQARAIRHRRDAP